MTTKSLLVGIISCLFFLSCSKQKGDIGGDRIVRGRLFLVDLISGNGTAKPLPGKTIYLAYDSEKDSKYLYTVTTDTAGYFLFENLRKNTRYNFRYRDSIGGAYVTADSSLQITDDKLDLALIAQPNLQQQNVLVVTCVDANGDPVPNASVCIFNNRTFADSNPCAGSILSLTANAQGKIIRYNVPTGTLHLNAQNATGVTPALTGQVRNVSIGSSGVSQVNMPMN